VRELTALLGEPDLRPPAGVSRTGTEVVLEKTSAS